MSNELQPPASPVVAQQGQGSASTSAGQQKPPEQTAEQGKDGGGLNQNQAQAGTGTQGDGVGAVKESPEELRAQLDAVRRELAANLQKKQSIDRTLVGSGFFGGRYEIQKHLGTMGRPATSRPSTPSRRPTFPST